jgi:hypothetical protein
MPKGFPVAPTLATRVLTLRDQGTSQRSVSKQLGLSRCAVQNCEIRRRDGRLPKTPHRQLGAHETLLDEPKRCENGHLCQILPCRTCKTAADLAGLRRLVRRADQLKRAG